MERDLDEDPDRLDEEPERLDPARDEPERLEELPLDEPERDEPERDEAERDVPERPEELPLDEPDRDEPDRDEPDRDEPERDEPERDEPERDEPERDDEPDRALLARAPELRDPLDERLEPFDDLRDLLDEGRRDLLRDVPLRRSAAGTSSLATAFASCVICFSRNLAIRSSSRRIPRASLTVSLSLTASASASMPVYVAISSNSLWYSVFAFLSIFSA